jgi:hypothetical protein
MELDISKLEKLLYDDDDFKKLTKITNKKKRTIFNIIVKDRDELTFSRVLKYFLDPKEDHNLQDYFLREFLHLLVRNSSNNINDKEVNRIDIDTFNLNDVNVFREYSIGEDGRLDIFIELRDKFACIIENKLFSDEGNEQTLRYEKWAKKNLLNKYEIVLLCYLTPDAQISESDFFNSINFNEIITIFDPERVKSKLNLDNQFLLKNFYEWIKEVKPMNEQTKEICMNIYKKYKEEINMILLHAPTIAAFMQKIAKNINHNNSNVKAHSGKDWLTLCPDEWISNENLKYSKKCSKVWFGYDYKSNENLCLSLVVPNDEKYIEVIKNHSNEIFNKSYDNVKYYKNWGNIYYQLEIWESFIPEDYINEWKRNIKDYSEKIIDTMKKIRPIIEKDIIKIKIY